MIRSFFTSALVASFIALLTSSAAASKTGQAGSARGDVPSTSDRREKPACIYHCDRCQGACIAWSSDASMPTCLQYSFFDCNCGCK